MRIHRKHALVRTLLDCMHVIGHTRAVQCRRKLAPRDFLGMPRTTVRQPLTGFTMHSIVIRSTATFDFWCFHSVTSTGTHS